MRRLIIGISAASGAVYGVRTLEVLRDVGGIETHAVISANAVRTIEYETGRSVPDVQSLADVVHDDDDLAASIASGSFRTDGMIVAPCSMRTLSGIATSNAANLLVRAADVCLKDRRPLVLVVRETPLHLGHLRLMAAATEAGATIFPPVPSMYIRPASVAELVDHTIMRVLDQFGIDAPISPRWEGLPPGEQSHSS